MWKTFCHFYRANSIKTNSLTCNLLTKWSVSYKSVYLFWLNYFWHWMWKRFCYSDRANSNLKIDIFDIGCEKHSRRNAFWTHPSWIYIMIKIASSSCHRLFPKGSLTNYVDQILPIIKHLPKAQIIGRRCFFPHPFICQRHFISEKAWNTFSH